MGRQQLHLMTSLNSWAGLWPVPHCLLKISENSPFWKHASTKWTFDNVQNFMEFFVLSEGAKMKNLHMLYRPLKHNRKPRPVKGPGTYLSKVDCDWPPVFSELGVLGLYQWGWRSLWQLLFCGGGTAILSDVLQEEVPSGGWCLGYGPAMTTGVLSHPTAKLPAREPPLGPSC